MNHEQAIADALAQPNAFEALRESVHTMIAGGMGRDAALRLLETARDQMRRQGRDQQEDIILEVMDCVVGWCSPAMKLTDSTPISMETKQR